MSYGSSVFGSATPSVDFITIFTTKSHRVKGLCFHPTRPWLLAALHNGVIQLWDYRVGTRVDSFSDHSGPVRSVDFHPTQPMFVSGSDDSLIKVWNYKERRCLFTLVGHLDYIRTVQFHHEYPWILSCSDDQTIRIWNWQSRECIAVLTGHSHYVMSARFHPTDDLIVTSSLDYTVRVWDISGLRKKHFMPQTHAVDDVAKVQNELFGLGDAMVRHVIEGHEKAVNWAAFHPNMPLIISGGDDKLLKLWRMNESKAWEVDTLRGHLSNVSCAVFHPKAELLLSNGEDKALRIWDLSRRQTVYVHRREHERFWYLAVHPKQALFAAGHDGGLIVFKLVRALYELYISQIFYFAHSQSRERTPASVHADHVYYVKERYLRHHNLSTGQDEPLFSLRASKNSTSVRSVSYSPRDHAVIITYASGSNGEDLVSGTSNGSSSVGVLRYEVYALPQAGSNVESATATTSGSAYAVSWLRRGRIAVLIKPNLIQVVSTTGEVVKSISPPHSVDNLLDAPTDCLLLRNDERVTLWDVQQERPLGQLKVARVRSAVWQASSSSALREGGISDGPLVALLCRGAVVVCTRRLERLYHIPETLRLKSAVWDETGTLLYNTTAHIKYCLPPTAAGAAAAAHASVSSELDGDSNSSDRDLAAKGDHGIIRTLDRTVYLLAAQTKTSQLYLFDRSAKLRAVTVDTTEYLFKRALAFRKYSEVLSMVRSKALIGKSIVGYLQRAGHPELALYYVEDPLTRFNLALQSQHSSSLDIALDAALKLNLPEIWKRLGQAALMQGEVSVVEKSYQQNLEFEKLSFLYFITGQSSKLKKMQNIATHKRQDVNAQYHTALLLGDIHERVDTLERAGQVHFAYLTALTHGLNERADQLRERMQSESDRVRAASGLEPVPLNLPTSPSANARLLLPPLPVVHSEGVTMNWPKTRMPRGPFDGIVQEAASTAPTTATTTKSLLSERIAVPDDEEVGGDWGNDDDLQLSDDDERASAFDDGEVQSKHSNDEVEEGEGWGEDELELDELVNEADTSVPTSGAEITLPPAGQLHTEIWSRNSTLPAHQIAAGRFDLALTLLNEQIGLINGAPLRPLFMRIYRARAALLPLAVGLHPLRAFLDVTTIVESNSRTILPMLPFDLQSNIETLGEAYKLFTAGKFAECLDIFRTLLQGLSLLVVNSKKESNEVSELVSICREYILGLSMELSRKELATTSPERALELAAFFSHTQLQSKHLQLVLKQAMNAAAKLKNFGHADEFGRRLLDLHPDAKTQEHTEKVLRLCDQKGLHNAVNINYDHRNPFVICASTFQAIYKGTEPVRCGFCQASFVAQVRGEMCPICQLSEIGRTASGLVSYLPPPEQR